jgi:hypothetical protein
MRPDLENPIAIRPLALLDLGRYLVRRPTHPPALSGTQGSGMPRSRQIFRAKKSLISRWRGTAEVCRFTGLTYTLC